MNAPLPSGIDVAVVIVSYNTAALTRKAVASAYASSGVGVQVWVVDMSRLRATDAGLRFPGDPVDSANQGPRLPSIFQHQGQSPDGNPSGSP